jgi:hypothetical protein
LRILCLASTRTTLRASSSASPSSTSIARTFRTVPRRNSFLIKTEHNDVRVAGFWTLHPFNSRGVAQLYKGRSALARKHAGEVAAGLAGGWCGRLVQADPQAPSGMDRPWLSSSRLILLETDRRPTDHWGSGRGRSIRRPRSHLNSAAFGFSWRSASSPRPGEPVGIMFDGLRVLHQNVAVSNPEVYLMLGPAMGRCNRELVVHSPYKAWSGGRHWTERLAQANPWSVPEKRREGVSPSIGGPLVSCI